MICFKLLVLKVGGDKSVVALPVEGNEGFISAVSCSWGTEAEIITYLRPLSGSVWDLYPVSSVPPEPLGSFGDTSAQKM